MNASKHFLKSRTVWGAIVSVATFILAVFGYSIDATTESELIATGVAFGGVVGSVLTVVGRLKAKKNIKFKKSSNGVASIVALILLPLVLQACALSHLAPYERGLAIGQEMKAGYVTLHEQYNELHASASPEGRQYLEDRVAPLLDQTKRAVIAFRDAAQLYARTKVEPTNWDKLSRDADTLLQSAGVAIRQAFYWFGGAA